MSFVDGQAFEVLVFVDQIVIDQGPTPSGFYGGQAFELMDFVDQIIIEQGVTPSGFWGTRYGGDGGGNIWVMHNGSWRAVSSTGITIYT